MVRPSVTAPRLSIIIPALNEQRSLVPLFDDIAALRTGVEVILVDGGSTDDTRDVARHAGARVLESKPGRGIQLCLGAQHATAPMLCFLHADVRIPEAARRALETIARTGERGAWAFRLRIDGARRAYRAIEWSANTRSALLGLPYGDQGLVIARSRYDEVGGYADLPIMEDVAIARALRKTGGIALLPAALLVSPRRWERDGVLGRSIRNAWLLTRYLTGSAPSALSLSYQPNSLARDGVDGGKARGASRRVGPEH